VPTLTSRGFEAVFAVLLARADVAVVCRAVDLAAVRFAGVGLGEPAFLAMVFVARLVRSGRSLMTLTSMIVGYLTLVARVGVWEWLASLPGPCCQGNLDALVPST
jgi:hypothetical protein